MRPPQGPPSNTPGSPHPQSQPRPHVRIPTRNRARAPAPPAPRAQPLGVLGRRPRHPRPPSEPQGPPRPRPTRPHYPLQLARDTSHVTRERNVRFRVHKILFCACYYPLNDMIYHSFRGGGSRDKTPEFSLVQSSTTTWDKLNFHTNPKTSYFNLYPINIYYMLATFHVYIVRCSDQQIIF